MLIRSKKMKLRFKNLLIHPWMILFFCSCIIILVAGFAYSEEAEKVDDRIIDLKNRELSLRKKEMAFEREKWEYEKAQKEKEEFEKQFPNVFDIKRDIPTYELQGYVNDIGRRYMVKVFTILLENDIDTVRINISSFGGSAVDGMGVADTIEHFKGKGLKIIGYAYGKIASAAVPVFASCSERITGLSTIFMVHEATMFKFLVSESKRDIDAQKEMMDKLEKQYIDILVRNTKMDEKHWTEAIRKETWFTAEQALEWGLIDKIE